MEEDKIKKIDDMFKKIESINRKIKKEILSILENEGDIHCKGGLKYPIKRGNTVYMIDYVFSNVYGEIKMGCAGRMDAIITEPYDIDEVRMMFGFIKESIGSV